MLNDKKLNKIEKELGKDTLSELEALDVTELKSRVTQAEMAVKQAVDELDANGEYQELLESKKAMEEAMKAVKKRQGCVTQYCLHLLQDKGQE